MSTLWLRLSATFHEHPKMLAVRADAGSRADSAELGWYRVLMASKRYGRWNFASEPHLVHVAGAYYRFVPLYRAHGLLDGLTIHDGDSYNAIKTDAERKAEQRERDRVSHTDVTPPRDMPRDQNVTLQTDRQSDKEDRQTHDGLPNLDKAAIRALEERTGHTASQAGDKQLNEYDRLVGDHGLPATLAAFDTVRAGKRMTARQLVWGAVRVLEPFVDPKLLAKDEREAERQQASRRGIERTQAYLADLRGETA